MKKKMKMLLLAVASVMSSVLSAQATFNVSLELQGGNCSDQLTLICRHSEAGTAPLWIHNWTLESGSTLGDAFPGAVYTVLTRTEHTATITGVDNVRALDGYVFQCAYEDLGNLTKSNAVKYSFIPPDYQPTLSLMGFIPDFSERLCTFNYSYQESCSLYPRCTSYFSVEYTVSPPPGVSNSSIGCSVEFTILNLMRCVSYQSTATALLANQRGNPVVVGDTVMLSPGRFTIISVSIGVDRNLVNVTYIKNEPDCPSYPAERYTVDVDGVQVADLTADEFQSQAINHANGSVTLSLPLNQPLAENAVRLNMTKYNTVPTNRSDNMGKMVTEMVPWGTSALFNLSQESSAAMNDEGEVSVGGVVGAIILGTIIFGIVVAITIAVALVIALRQKAKQCGSVDIKPTVSSGQEDPDISLDLEHGRLPPSGSASLGSPSKTLEGEPKSCNGREERPTMEKKRKPMGGVQPMSHQNDVLGGMGGTLPSPAITEESFVLDYDTEDPHYPMTEDIKQSAEIERTDSHAVPTCNPLPLKGQGQQTSQGLTYITVGPSQRRPINVSNENLDVQYTGVKFNTEAPAV